MAFGWLKKAVRSAGKVVTAPVKAAVKVAAAPVKLVAKAGRTISKELGKVPIVGGGLKGVFDLTINAPFQVAGQVASGTRIDKVATNALKAHVRSVKAVAPYAQLVISNVPAIGPGISGAISAGLALASGQPITQVLAEGVKGALPGGPLAKSVFSASQAVVEGKPATQILLSTIPLDSNSKKGLALALDVSSRIAKGQRVDKALIAQADRAISLLPKDAAKAFQVGTAVAEAQRLQKIAVKHVNPKTLNALQQGGKNIIQASPVLSSAGAILKSSGSRAGYEVGAAVMATHQPQPFHVAAIRANMKGEQKAGFDVAVAAHTGMAKYHGLTGYAGSRITVPPSAPASQKLGFYITTGLSQTSTAPAIARVVRTNPATRIGADKAIEKIETERPSFFERVKIWLIGE